MTGQEVIKEVKRWTAILMNAGSECIAETAEAQDIAIKALEKQNPKEMVWSPDCDSCKKYGTADCTNECGSYGANKSVLVCPNCKIGRPYMGEHKKYCSFCGQAIKH